MNKEKKKLTKGEKNVLRIMLLVVAFAFGTFGWIMYANDFYEAEMVAKKAMFGNANIEVEETEKYYLFHKKDEQSKKGIVFYPGGKVDETAYAPMLMDFTECGYEVYLVKMPAKLAIFGMRAAEGIFLEASHIEDWTMMGHSLGGAMAASFSADHEDKVENLVLLAAYSTEDLKETDIDVFSFYGTQDKVLNMKKYQKYRDNLPEDTIEEVIEGGNHSSFAYYGEQEGDGTAFISREEQQECVLDVFCFFEKE